MICGSRVDCEVTVLDGAQTKALTDITPNCEVHIALAVRALRAMGARNIVLHGGEEIAVCVGQEITLLPARNERSVSDAFMQLLEQKLAEGETLIKAVRFAAGD